MSRRVRPKTAQNIFCAARYKAATHNKRLFSREGAAEEVYIDRTRIARIELDIITPYPEEVLLMADGYNAPELPACYCRKYCPIGRKKKRRLKRE